MKTYFLDEFAKQVKGTILSQGHFGANHKVITNHEYNSFSNRIKPQFSHCYNVVLFKTQEAQWELFFHLIKEGLFFTEVLSLRAFPIKNKIHSEGNVEMNYSRLNIFTNNRYLTAALEHSNSKEYLKWLIRQNGDILLISHNNLHFKATLNKKKKKLNVQRGLDMVKAMHNLRNIIFKSEIIEY